MTSQDALLTLLQLVALLFPAIGLVLQGTSMINRGDSKKIHKRDAFILARFSFIPLTIAAIILLLPFVMGTSGTVAVQIAPVFIGLCLITLLIAVCAMQGHGLQGLVKKSWEIIKNG